MQGGTWLLSVVTEVRRPWLASSSRLIQKWLFYSVAPDLKMIVLSSCLLPKLGCIYLGSSSLKAWALAEL